MPSPQYVSMTSRGRIKSFSENRKGSDMIGGAVPLLLNRIIKEPIKGGAIDVPRTSNILVGTVTSSNTQPSRGGELLNSIQKLKFGKGTKKRSDQNIKFLF